MAAGIVFTNAGRAIATNLVSVLGGTVPKYVDWGRGTTTPVAANTAIETATGGAEARTSGTVTRTTTSVTNDTVQVVGTITAVAGSNGQAITESGLFDASTSGNMFTHAVFASITVATGDSIQFTWTWQLT
jgi:hypothetical protein